MKGITTFGLLQRLGCSGKGKRLLRLLTLTGGSVLQQLNLPVNYLHNSTSSTQNTTAAASSFSFHSFKSSSSFSATSIANLTAITTKNHSEAAATNSTHTDKDMSTEYEYDLVVIGGGSGGLATSKKAAGYGKKVALFDYVRPSSQGTVWGLGGTCVNVGCVPKKLMHYAALLGASFHDAQHLGWEMDSPPTHNWETLVEAVQNHVKMLNFRYRVGLKSANVSYINARATITGPHEITYERRGKTFTTTAEKILIAVGGRPSIPDDVPGARELAISSDDIFSLARTPGKTLVVGASYIALECAGFLNELGYDVTIAVRSILLRGFDQQCAEKIGEVMDAQGCRFIRGVVPSGFTKDAASGKITATLVDSKTKQVRHTEEYDTVLYAVGRTADTAGLGLEAAGVKVAANGKIPVDNEQTNVPHIYALGDASVVDFEFANSHWANPELTPLAIQVGDYLAARWYGGSSKKMDYRMVPTTVFTPAEYGVCGLSEEDAERCYGKENIETYLNEFGSLEHQAVHRMKRQYGSKHGETAEDDMVPMCLSKLVCLKTEDQRVVGFHFVGPNAGEMTQGFALAVRLGAKKSDFDDLVGIHPTDAESFVSMSITRASGQSFTAEGGCGGGVCG